ncbi:protein kinase [Pseudoalteromonas sp.]|uniref:protein kinase domain-containing protein n=1 Tax=Pseudoalteromonas sp. TaxID=53249 RepID=UPI0035694A5F
MSDIDKTNSPYADELSATQLIYSASSLQPGECLVGRFEIVALHSQGRYGLVYRAYDKQLDTVIAIKVLHETFAEDQQAIADFKQELLLVRQLSHPNIIRVHEYYQHDNLHFITMDWIDGISLEEAIAKELLSADAKLTIIAQLLDGLAFAQQADVTHKDIKPENILLDKSGRLYIGDFGLSVFNNNAALGNVVGTPFYAPPEYLQSGKINASTDLYAAGTLMFQLCCHYLPFTGNSIDELLQNKLLSKPKFSAQQVELEPLKAFILSLISPHPASRPANIELAQQQFINLTTVKTQRSRWRIAFTILFVIALMLSVFWLFTQQKPIKANATDHYALAVLPSAANNPQFDQTFANYLSYQLGDIKNLRVVEQARLTQLFQQLGITVPLDNSKIELLTDLLQVDVLINPQLFSTGAEKQEIQFELIFVDGFNIQREALLREAFDNSNWSSVTTPFATILKERLNISGQAVKAIAFDENPLIDLFPIKTLIQQGQFAEAQQALDKTLLAKPQSAQVWLLQAELFLTQNSILSAEQAYSKVLEFSAADTYSAKFASARLNDLAGKVEQAQADYLSLVAAFPYNTELKVVLSEFYFFNGQYSNMEALLLEVVELDPYHPTAWFMLGRAAYLQGNFEQSLDEYFTKALVTAKKLKNVYQQGEALNAFGVVYDQLGEVSLAFDYYRQALAKRKMAGNLSGVATTMTNLAYMHIAVGQFPEADSYLQQSVATYQQLGDQEGIAKTYTALGVLAEAQALYQDALGYYRNALNIRMSLNNQQRLAESMNNVGFSYFMLLDAEHALVYWRQAEQLYQQIQYPIGVIHVRQNLGQIELAKGNWRNAYHLFNNTLADAQQLNSSDEALVSRSYLTKLAFLQGNFNQSVTQLKGIFDEAQKINNVRATAEFGLWLADWSLQLGDTAQAAKHLATITQSVMNNGNQEHQAILAFLNGQIEHKLPVATALNNELLTVDHGHKSVYIRQLIYAARETLRQGGRDITALLAKLAKVDFSLHQYEYIEYLELVAVQQYFLGSWQQLAETLRETDLLLRKMGGYWRSFQFDRLRAQLALANKQDPAKYHQKVANKLRHLQSNLPPALTESFIENQHYFALDDGLQDLLHHDP